MTQLARIGKILPTKPNQQLRRDLKEAAALLKWSGVDLMKMAIRLSEAGLRVMPGSC